MAIKTAIIGLGIMGQRMLEHMMLHPDYSVEAIWDPDAAACQAAQLAAPTAIVTTNAIDAIAAADQNPWLYNHRAWIRWNRQNYDGAQSDWRKAIEFSPTTAGFYYNMGLVYEKGGNIDEAVKYFKKAQALKPDEQKYTVKVNKIVVM